MAADTSRTRWGYELIFDSAPCGYVITQLDGLILDVNETFLGWTGFVREDLVEHTRLADLLTPSARVVHEIYHLTTLEQARELHDSPSEFVCADGSRLPAMISSVVGRTGAQGAEVIVNAISDASARREYERELRHARDEERAARARAEELAQDLARRARHDAAIAELGRLALAQTDPAALVTHTVELISTTLGSEAVSLLRDAAEVEPGATLLRVDDAEEHDYFIVVDAPVTREDLAFLETISQLLRIAIQRRQSEDHHRHLALHDPLTGLANRSLLIDRLTQALARQARDAGPFALMMIDLNRFKAVNDTHGHYIGDELLRHVATRLISAVRASDTVARFGGDEFAVVCEDLDEEAARDMADRVRVALSQPVELVGRHIPLEASVGMIIARADGAYGSPVDLLQAADADMYRHKRPRPH